MVLPATASWHRCWHERGRKHATSQSCHAQAPAAALLVPVCTLPGSSTLDKLMHLVRSGDRRLSRDDNSPSNGHPHEWTSDFSQPLKIEAEEKKFRMSMLSSQASLVAKILAASCKMRPEALTTDAFADCGRAQENPFRPLQVHTSALRSQTCIPWMM